MIDIVIPCSVNKLNKVELVTIGQIDIPWSPNWSSLFGINKVLIYDLISDKSLIDNEVTINVGHTTIKLNDLKFIFKLNGIHSNCKLYYDATIVDKLVKNSICANILMNIIDYCETWSLTAFTQEADGQTFSLDSFMEHLSNYNMSEFVTKFIELTFNDMTGVHCIESSMIGDQALNCHKGFNNYIVNKQNNVKRAAEYACNKIIDLLQIDRSEYSMKVNTPIPAGPMAFIPIRPNFTRSTLFNLIGQTEEGPIEGYSSSVLFYKCQYPITSSFFLYAYDGKITISNRSLDLRPVFVRAKDGKLSADIINNSSDPNVINLKRQLNNTKIFDEIPLCFDLLNKAFKALTAGDLIYFYAVTGCVLAMDNYTYEKEMVIHELNDETLQAIRSYDIIGLALGGVKTDGNQLTIN